MVSWGSQDGGRSGGESETSSGRRSRVPDAPRSSSPEAASLPGSWTARPVVAAVVRTVAFLTPFAIALITAWSVSRLLPEASTWEWAFARIVVIVIATVAMVVLAKRAVRRLGPLSALLRLSAAFPQEAPNRFTAAMQMPSARHLERVLNGEQAPGRSLASADGSVAGHIVTLMTAVSAHHPRTRGHSERVRAYADLIGEELELEPDERERLRWAALLHDVGKVSVPVEILDKSDRPDLTEWAVLEQHPERSVELAAPVRDWLGPWWGGIGEHHERWDGTGYPNRLRGNEITLAGRIVAVADSFETMTEVRSYKQPMSFDAAQQELVASAGTHFDPAVVRAFLGISTSRVRRAAGWAAWLPGPLVEAGHTVITATSVAGPAGVAATAAVSLIVPGIASEVVQGPNDPEPQLAEAAELDEADPDADSDAPVEVTIAPGPTVVVSVPSELSEPTAAEPAPSDPTDPVATETTAAPATTAATTSTTSTSVAEASDAVTTTSVASAPPLPAPPPTTVAPGTTVVSPVTSPPVTTTPPSTAPSTQPTTSTTSPATTVPASTTSTTAVTPPPRWIGTPSFNSSGRTIFATGIDVEGWGLQAMCRLWLPDVVGFVETDIPCSTLMSVLAPEPNTTYEVRLQARTSAGATDIVEAQVTTGS